jgi:hypothetical protein
MPELQEARVAAAVLRTLEDAAFVFAAPADEAEPFEGDVLEARLSWAGAAEELRLATSPELAAEIAANLLGVERAAVEHAADALGELLNMAAGIVVAEAFGGRAAPRLELPRVALVSASAHTESAASARIALTLLDEADRRIDVAVAARRPR